MARRPALRRLSERLGILSSYVSQQGRVVPTRDATRATLCRALGFEVASEAACRRALESFTRRLADRRIESTRVVRGRSAAARTVAVRWPASGAPFDWTLALTLEDGSRHQHSGRTRGRPPATLHLPVTPPPGYHTVDLILGDGSDSALARQRLIVTPSTCPRPSAIIGRRRAFGVAANLYTIRSRSNWGIGDTGDLRTLVQWCGALGGAFVGLNPLHALGAGADAVSPYSPVSRLYRDPLYLDVEQVPEFASTPRARRRVRSSRFQRELATLRAADTLDYERVRQLKSPILRMLHVAFVARHRDRGTARGRAFAAYCKGQGPALIEFARAAAARAGATEGRSRAAIGYHCWLQFELERQLAAVARVGRRVGMPLGIYHDLALGSVRDGSDITSFPGLFVDGANLGAPPDDYSKIGQDWGLPPINPHRLADDGFRYWILLAAATALAHAGMLRIDHVMGLARQYWIPRGRSGTDGAYVRFPVESLLGILALEAERAGALIVGEDIGTVPRGFREHPGDDGEFCRRDCCTSSGPPAGDIPPEYVSYPARALVSVNNHDQPPLGRLVAGARSRAPRTRRDCSIDEVSAEARQSRVRERQGLVRRLDGRRRCLSGG